MLRILSFKIVICRRIKLIAYVNSNYKSIQFSVYYKFVIGYSNLLCVDSPNASFTILYTSFALMCITNTNLAAV
jgi:hypothetical protein